MKKQILKIAKVKNIDEFYRKFPTEEAFMAKHGKALKKAVAGGTFDFQALSSALGNLPQQSGNSSAFIDKLTGLVQAPGGVVTQDQTQSLGFGNTPAQPAQPKQQTPSAGGKLLDQAASMAGPFAKPLGQVINAGRKINQAVKQAQSARQLTNLANLSAQVSGLTPERINRKYVRPEDNLVQPGELGDPYGMGTNFLAKNGMEIGGNLTEIQNMYNPGDIYSDMGYEPLDDSNKIKQFRKGGRADLGLIIAGANQVGKSAEIAGNIGSGIINIGTENRMKRNAQTLGASAFQQGAQNLQQGQFNAFMEDGGWVSNDWQPQVIAKFGEYDVDDLLKNDPTMDTLRTGGNLRQNTMMQMGGELQTYWGGYAEPISENPYLPDGGETVMFRGQSHDESDGQGRTGIGITYGDNPVEVERGEPAMKLRDGGSDEESLVVFGNMKIPSYGVSELDDPKAKGKKFKNYINDISKTEAKQNKVMDKSLKLVEDTEGDDPFDLLKLSSAKAMMSGANMKLKDIANKKQTAAGIQNAILDTAEEYGLESDALAKGKIKKAKSSDMAKFGAKLETAQKGKKLTPKEVNKVNSQLKFNSFKPTQKQIDLENMLFNIENPEPAISKYDSQKTFIRDEYRPEKFNSLTKLPTAAELKEIEERNKNNKSWYEKGLDAYEKALPYIRPSNRMPLEGSQLIPEMFALSANQLEPVQAQQYRPMLGQVSDISLQDQLNAIQSDFNSIQRQVGYNPAALSQLAAQKYAATSNVLGQQFKANQAARMDMINRNREVLNDATLKNLGIQDQQYQRQSQAKSATKQQAFTALSSIADKIAKNKLENRTLGVYENMYDYRFGPEGRAINMNAPYKFNTQIGATKTADAKTSSKRNGSIVKAIKNL
jgi:hypothetical protein